jgi:hypothetical protein
MLGIVEQIVVGKGQGQHEGGKAMHCRWWLC